MAKLNEKQKELLRTMTVELLLELRRGYLAAGANPLKHWAQLQNRMLSAARRSTGPDEWATAMMRGLQIPVVSKSVSLLLLALGAGVREMGAAREWLDMIEREFGLLMAMTRLAAERQKEERDNAAKTI